MAINLDTIQYVSTADRQLVEHFLNTQPHHNHDRILEEAEYKGIFNRNIDHFVDENDWQLISTPNYPISKSLFFWLARFLSGACDPDDRLRVQVMANTNQKRLADIHTHFGGNASPEFIYNQALDRVGPSALNPNNWGEAIDISAAVYTDYHTFQKRPLDDVIRDAVVNKTLPAEIFIPPSDLIRWGQEAKRQLNIASQDGSIPEDTLDRYGAILKRHLDDFADIATYRAPINPELRDGNELADFLGVYRFASTFVERETNANVFTAAIWDAMKNFSEQGVGYVEMRLALPEIAQATAAYPGVPPDIAVNTLVNDIYSRAAEAIQNANKKLIAEGLDPVDLRLIAQISRRASRKPDNLLQAKAIVLFLENHPEHAHWIVGIDGGSAEVNEPPQLYKEHFKIIQEYNHTVPSGQQLGITWHQGEDFTDTNIFGALLRLRDVVEMGASRIGHALAAGIDPLLYALKPFTMPIDEYIRFLDDEMTQNYATPVPPCVEGALPNPKEEKERVITLKDAGFRWVAGHYPGGAELEQFVTAVRERQKFFLTMINKRGIPIELNPTSNMQIVTGSFDNHPLPFFLNEGARITINTDDAGIFATSSTKELNIAQRIGGLDQTALDAIVDEGFRSSFAVSVRGESLEHLRD
ncbi:MAG: hypothetical protein HQM16_11230 [Deltaproteobacteria bacterium]|nr:hypothetical protein [Deltaproteobacteria bacterium]